MREPRAPSPMMATTMPGPDDAAAPGDVGRDGGAGDGHAHVEGNEALFRLGSAVEEAEPVGGQDADDQFPFLVGLPLLEIVEGFKGVKLVAQLGAAV